MITLWFDHVMSVNFNPPPAPLNPCMVLSIKTPWNRLQIDYVGTFQNRYIINAHSKWIKALSVSTPSTSAPFIICLL